MSVKYDVVYKDGFKLKVTSVCFGKMEKTRWPEMGSVGGREDNQQAFIQFYTDYQVHPMWYYDAPELKRDFPSTENGDELRAVRTEAGRKFCREMKELLADMPMLKGLVTIHPLLCVVRVHVKHHTADQVMLALFLFRNLCQYGNNAFTYRVMRAKGYRPRLAAILAHQLSTNQGSFNRNSYSVMYLGEYNWINPQTFGKQAFLRLMNHTEDTEFDFCQPLWRNEKGYRRDSHFKLDRDGEKIFDPQYTEGDTDRSGRNKHAYWKLVSALSIPADEPIAPEQYWDAYDGFFLSTGNAARTGDECISSSRIDSYLANIETLCEEHGIQHSL